MSPLTIYLGKLFGLYCMTLALGMMANRRVTLAAVESMIRSPPILLFVDIVTLSIGLAMVLGHNIWSGGALPVVVTVLGWATLIKGLLFLFLPQERMIGLYKAMQYERLFFVYMAGTLVIGLYLTVAAFSA